ncbi:MAG: dTMP kinase [Methylococcales bacterium]|jgi:dTMP kinase
MIRGKFITLEGGEGVGKTTNLVFIKSCLEQYKVTVTLTREPGGTELAEKLRQLLLNKDGEAISEQAELLMIFAARAQHIKHVIEPALAKGNWVLCDRFTDATYAYQGGGRNINRCSIEWLENLVQKKLKPDLTILLDAPIEIGLARAKKRANLDRFESEKTIFFEQVRQSYLFQAAQYPERIKLIKADQPLTLVQNELAEIIETFF